MNEYEKVLKALANRRRLSILKYLKEKKEATVGELAAKIKLSFKSTSKHMAVLSAADIVEKDQKNLSMFYYISSKQSPVSKNILELL